MIQKLVLEIDYREKSIINFFKSDTSDQKDTVVSDTQNTKDKNTKVNYNVCNLTIGDFVFKEYHEDGEIIHYIIERKTISDLASSIIDGRFREQKQRLLESIGTNDKIIYIIEDDKTQRKIYNLSKTIIDSSILNLIFKHKYKVIHTTSEKDTYDILLSMYKKLTLNEFEKTVITNMPFKSIKKTQNLDIFSNMLSIIPGVSITSAQKIKEKYNSMAILLDEYNKIDDIKDKYHMLSDIQLNNKRRLGNALSKKIYLSIFEDVKEIKDVKDVKNSKEIKDVKDVKNVKDSDIICLID